MNYRYPYKLTCLTPVLFRTNYYSIERFSHGVTASCFPLPIYLTMQSYECYGTYLFKILVQVSSILRDFVWRAFILEKQELLSWGRSRGRSSQTDRNIETPSQQFFSELPHGATASFTSSHELLCRIYKKLPSGNLPVKLLLFFKHVNRF